MSSRGRTSKLSERAGSMILKVGINFSSAEHEGEWNYCYTSHLRTLLSVQGIETAQRLRARSR
jgi:hypothetical protein